MPSEDALAEGTKTAIALPCARDPLVSILIPTTSQAGCLLSCLKSLEQNLGDDIPVEVIVVLNAATDEVKALMSQQVSGAVVCDSPANLGVAGGNNRGRSLARGRYLALIHDDTEIQPQWLESLVGTAEAHPEAGAVASMVLYPDGKLQGAGAILWKEGLTSQAWGPVEAQPEEFTSIRPVDYAGTSSILIRAETWDAIGGLDERLYPAYYIDVDLCMAIRKHGQIVLCDPRSRVFHRRGSSSGLAYRLFIASRNRELFASKWKEELESHESYAPNDIDAVARAHAHTARVADLLTGGRAQMPAREQTGLDAARQDAEHLKKERELQRAYISDIEHRNAMLQESNAVLEAERAASEQRCASLENHCHQVVSEFEAERTAAKAKLTARNERVEKWKSECARLKEQLSEAQRTKRQPWHQRLIARARKLWKSE